MRSRNTTVRRCELPRLPLERVHVEVTSLCNFACEFCPNPSLMRPGGLMELDLLAEILDEVAASGVGRRVYFHQQGEPLLHPGLADAVAHATSLKLETSVTTNGALLTEAAVDRLVGAGLTELVVSLQTPDEASFAIRGAKNLTYPAFEERVVRAVARVLASGGHTDVRVAFLTKPLPRFTLPFVGGSWRLVEHTRELRALLLAWAERWLPALPDAPAPAAVRRAIGKAGVLHRNEIRLHPRLLLEARPVGAWPMPERDYGRPWREATWGTCHGISEHIAILWDGSYAFCCADHNGRTSTARFQELSLLDYLDSAPVQEALAGFRRLRPTHPYCRQCLGGPHPIMVFAKSVGSVAYFKIFSRMRRESRA
ncbi:MAG: radical SAM protein [Acidobacteria bacterium]|nr:radical SAM protein [Acidobacteriota bacterium]